MTRPDSGRSRVKWGTTFPQRLRLAPLWLALTLADVLAPGNARPPRVATGATRRPGLSVVIPERDAPDMLDAALASLIVALKGLAEPFQIIVVANGAPRERYRDIVARYPKLELVQQAEPLGFSAAVLRGLERARYDWTLLLNNDMTLAPDALRELAACRADDVFAVAAQIMQQGPDGRREETGFTDWYVDPTGIRVFHAPPDGGARAGLCASGGAGLFRTAVLRRYARSSRCYDPFYWEDVEWGVRAQRDGYRVVFCPSARANHRHRATTSRFYSPAAIERVVERNRTLFDLRNAASGADVATLLQRVCDQPYASQRELAAPGVAARVLARALASAPARAALAAAYTLGGRRHCRALVVVQLQTGGQHRASTRLAGVAVLRISGPARRRPTHRRTVATPASRVRHRARDRRGIAVRRAQPGSFRGSARGADSAATHCSGATRR